MVAPSVDRLVEGAKVSIAYEHRYRVVEIIRGPWQSSEGNWLVTAIDEDRITDTDPGIRSFRIDRIQNEVHPV